MRAPMRSRIEPGDGDPRHGSDNGYNNLGCRCQPCKDAHAAYTSPIQHGRRGTLPLDDERHGTYNGYRNYGCRCDECKAAQTTYGRDYYLNRRPTGPGGRS